MAKQIILTPQNFFDLFVLCLSWKSDFNLPRSCNTTVDHVVRILQELGVVSKKQGKIVFGCVRTQQLFISNIEKQHTSTSLYFEHSHKRLVVRYDFSRDFSRQRMLRDYRIYLSLEGKKYAESIEDKYRCIVSKEEFCNIHERKLPAAAMGKIMPRYNKRVEEQCDD